jgi:hypothetical protein
LLLLISCGLSLLFSHRESDRLKKLVVRRKPTNAGMITHHHSTCDHKGPIKSISQPQPSKPAPKANKTQAAVKDFTSSTAHFRTIRHNSIAPQISVTDAITSLLKLISPFPSSSMSAQLNTINRRMLIMVHSSIFACETLQVIFRSLYRCMT